MTNEPNQEPQTKAELLQRIREVHAGYQSVIDALDENLLTAPTRPGAWSVRDVMAHVGADEQWMSGQLEALHADEPPTAQSCYGDDVALPQDIDITSQDGRNAWQHMRLAGLALDEVQAMAATAHARIVAAVESFSDEEMLMDLTIADLPPMGHIRPPRKGEAAWPLWEWIRGVTYFHYADHVAGIRAAASSG